jgi:hypothetical protein
MGAAICFALFIKPDRVAALGYTLHGDGRDFSSDSDPGASRGYIWIPVADPSQWEAHMNQTGYIRPLYGDQNDWGVPAELGEWVDWKGPSEHNKWIVTADDKGEIIVRYDLIIAGDLESTAAHINGVVIFLPNGDGGYHVVGDRDGFPWAEAYYYDGKGHVQTIFQRPALSGNNGDPFDLFAIEPYTSNLFHDLGKTLFGNGAKEDTFWIYSTWGHDHE